MLVVSDIARVLLSIPFLVLSLIVFALSELPEFDMLPLWQLCERHASVRRMVAVAIVFFIQFFLIRKQTMIKGDL
jgi:hypothetical protein